MSQPTTLILLPQTAYVNPGNGAGYTVTGNSQPASAYYLTNKDLQTINVNLSSVTGNIYIDATLASTPVDSDWFTVYTLEANIDAPANTAPFLDSNNNSATNITGNYVSLRARIEEFKNGVVNYIKVSY